MAKLPRGIRNNNPLNIRKSGIAWQGKVTAGTDPDFEQFTHLKYGLRAAIVNIRTYIRRDHLDTIRQIVTRWAPPSENNTEAYVNKVSELSGIAVSQRIVYNDKSSILRIVRAMAQVECGQSLEYFLCEQAWSLI